MATITKTGAKGAQKQQIDNSPERLAAQQEWAKEQLTGADGKIATDKVVAVPIFVKKGAKWIPSDEVIRVSKNPLYGSVLLMGVGGGESNNIASLRWDNSGGGNLVTALHMAKIEGNLEDFEAGDVLEGRLDSAYQEFPTNPNNEDQDVYYVNAKARELGIPACNEDGEKIYSIRFWQQDLSKPKMPAPKVANMQDIIMQIAANKGKTA